MKSLIGLAILIALFLGAGIALYLVAENMEPPTQPVEEVIPDDRFPQ